jgi:predicted nucleic acid-binding protein
VIFVLDTNVVSELRRKRPNPTVARWIDSTDPRNLATTVVTIHEIQWGIERARQSSSAETDGIETWVEGLLATQYPPVLPMNVDAWRLLGKMYETPELRHFLVTDPRARAAATGGDLAIAAIAITGGFVIVTRNVRHFRQISARFLLPGLFDPFESTWHVEPSDTMT